MTNINDNYTHLCPLPRAFAGMRLDAALALLFPRQSRALWRRRILEGGVFVNGEQCRRPAHKLKGGEAMTVHLCAQDDANDDDDNNDSCAAEDIPLDIVYEDDDITVINKPPGLVVHPGRGNRNGTMQSALLFRRPSSANLDRAGIVHRLDKDTSGLLVVANNRRAQKHLIAQFQQHAAGREYLALVFGEPPQTGLIDRPLARSRRERTKMTVAESGREAITRFVVEKRWRGLALLRCFLQTGRTHQIRAHLEHCGYPLAGDAAYKKRARPLPFTVARQMLHAETLRLTHPRTGELKQWQQQPPPDMLKVLTQLDECQQTP